MNNFNLGFSTAQAGGRGAPMAQQTGQSGTAGFGASFNAGVGAGSGTTGAAGLAVILGLLVVGYIATRRLQGSLSV